MEVGSTVQSALTPGVSAQFSMTTVACAYEEASAAHLSKGGAGDH